MLHRTPSGFSIFPWLKSVLHFGEVWAARYTLKSKLTLTLQLEGEWLLPDPYSCDTVSLGYSGSSVVFTQTTLPVSPGNSGKLSNQKYSVTYANKIFLTLFLTG